MRLKIYVGNNLSNSIYIVFILILLQSCHSNKSKDLSVKRNETLRIDTVTLLTIKSFKEYTFNYNNDDFKQIGYEVWEKDEDVGVKSICLDENNLYLTDVYHNSIKKIDINHGTMASSLPIRDIRASKSGIWFRDITTFNNKIYVTSDNDSIYVFDKELHLIDVIPSFKGKKIFYRVTEDSLLVYINDTQLPDKSIQFDLQLITKDNFQKRINETITLRKYIDNRSKKEIQGKYYELSDTYIITKYGKLILRDTLPIIENYSARNLDFTKHCLAYFNSSQIQFHLFIYEY